jgi:presenilin-like A22 family membrane protease
VKHNYKIIIVLLSLFILSQVTGLWITHNYLGKDKLALGITPPEVESKNTSFFPIFFLILIATVFSLLLIRLRLSSLWRLWFGLTIWLTLSISFGSFLDTFTAIVIATIFSLLRLFKSNPVIHNFTEIFIYGALASLFTSIFNITSIILLLLLISIYDYIAVRKTKHMINLAKYEGTLKSFAGFLVPYKKGTAILGGGDIGFPLLFASVTMRELNLPFNSYKTFLIPFGAAIALYFLFVYGKKKKTILQCLISLQDVYLVTL